MSTSTTTSDSTGNNVIDIIKDANEQHGNFDINSVLSSVGFSLGISVILILAFSLIRPRNNVVYAPKIKYADEKHQPPKLKSSPWAWISPVIKLKEDYMIDRIGLDGVIFLRFLRLCRNYFAILTVLGCGVLIPINVIGTNATVKSDTLTTSNPLLRLTIYYLTGNRLIPHIAFSYVFTILLMYLIWVNYRKVVHLRQTYFNSDEYQASLHARTLMVMNVPAKKRTDNALARTAMDLKNAAQFSQAQMGRNVGKLPILIERHDNAVRKLEAILARYLKNPSKLPAHRPMCRGKNGQTDAIDYYTNQVQSLEQQIETARDNYDALHTMSYGFVSYPSIPAAHSVAKSNKRSDLFLAPRPHDIIWKNIAIGSAKRGSNRIFGNVLFVALCIFWTVPNALIATFISNLYNLGSVWPWFQNRINANPKLWAVLQGILSPVILALFFLLLPIIMRRISKWEGRYTKNARERNVFHKLFLFFFINNFLIFTLFGVLWSFVQSTIVETAQDDTGFSGFWKALKNSAFFDGLANAITSTSSFWIIYVAQRNLGCLLDLLQAWGLFLKWFKRSFLAPTPREMIEWSAPQNIDYATYYNNFLYNFAICISYATVAPLILPFALLYFVVGGFTFKYSLLYVAVTKVESGGAFWRPLVNRMLLTAGFSNLVLFVITWVKINIFTAIAVVPTMVLIIFFKIYLLKAFDPRFDYYASSDKALSMPVVHHNDLKKDRLRTRFGHPSLTQKLIVPMVHERSRPLLKEIYRGRLVEDPIDEHTPAVVTQNGLSEKFELVAADDLDYEHYRDRPDFFTGEGLVDDARSMRTTTTTTTTATTTAGQGRTGVPTGRNFSGPYSDSPLRKPVSSQYNTYQLRDEETHYDRSLYDADLEYGNDDDDEGSIYRLETFNGRPRFDDEPDTSGSFMGSQEDLTNLLRPAR